MNFSSLSGLKGLTHLLLSGTSLTNCDLAGLKSLAKLTILDLSKTGISSQQVEEFAEARQLQELLLSENQFSGSGLGSLKDAGNLRFIDLRECTLESTAWEKIGTLKQLKALRLDSSNIDGKHLGLLAKIPLQVLTLTKTKLTDADCEALLPLSRSLRFIDLQDTDLTDASVATLSRLKALSRLAIKGTKITRDGIEDLEFALPNCNIDLAEPDE